MTNPLIPKTPTQNSIMSQSTEQKIAEQQEQRKTNLAVAQIILQQLGSNRFKMMTGAKNFCAVKNGLSFRIPKSQNGINYVEIKLNGLDLYDISFKRIYGSKVTDVNDASDIYNDQLQAIFTENTGLYTHL